ncbi:MAG: caspase family protein [Caulobacteraceae bacterium]|nr:caspase family protein [Caulobacteraceae bacterium]
MNGKAAKATLGEDMTRGAALLFGNTKYRIQSVFGPLRTPANDVETLGDEFKALGFETYVVHDADRAVMGTALAQFREVIAKLPKRASVYVHFAGHGMQRGGENYLVPVDASGVSEADVLFSCIRLSEVMDALCWRDDQQKLIVLDACRSHHVPSTTRGEVAGLAGESPDRYERVNETFVFYATPAGRMAADGAQYGNSPFCLGIREALKTPGLPIAVLAAHATDFVYRMTDKVQRPWGTGNLCHLWPFVPDTDELATLVNSPVLAPNGNGGANAILDPADRYVAERGHLVHKLKAKDTTGRWAYYFVLVEPEKEAAFLASINGDGIIDIETYGSVVASSYGETPSEEVRAYLKERYGFAA